MRSVIITCCTVVHVSILAGNALAEETYGNKATNQVAAPQVAQQAASQTSGIISARISQTISGSVSGLSPAGGGAGPGTIPTPGGGPISSNIKDLVGKSAGSEDKPLGVWLNAGAARVSDTHAFETFHGSITTVVGGMDYRITERALAGLALGYESANIKTTFNNGTMRAGNVAVSPYVGYAFNDTFSLDATLGYAFVNYDMTRLNGQARGSTGGGRLFGAANLTAKTEMGNWRLSTGLGYLYLQETQDAYAETGSAGTAVSKVKIRLGQLRSTNKAGYEMVTSWGSITPYAMVRPEYDVNKSPAAILDTATNTVATSDRFGATFGLGLNMAVGDDSTINLEGTTSQFRSHLSMDGVTGTVRFRF